MHSYFKQNNTVSQKVWGLFAVAVFSLVLMLGIVFIELNSIIGTITETRRLRAITDELVMLGENLVDLETGQRGYQVTKDEAFLEPYLASIDLIDQRVSNLDSMVKDNIGRENLKQMQPVIQAKLDFTAECVRLVKLGQVSTARNMVISGKGKELMDEFRRVRSVMLERELKILNQYRADYEQQLFYVLVTLVVGGLLAVSIMFSSALTTTRRLKAPIFSLLEGISAMRQGRIDYKVAIAEQDEIGHISEAFNEMADDIVESRRVREEIMVELQRSNADLDKFAYVASHDLKAPLRGIRSLAQWIEEDVAETASQDTLENLKLLNNRVDRLDGLLESLLAYPRIGHKTELPENIDIAKLITDVADYLAPGPNFIIRYQGNISSIYTSKVPLELVLRNLLNNAVKHHDLDSGKVLISAQALENLVEFRVQDDGPGVPAEFKERIFEMFQTLKPRDQVEGSGMGLAIVRKTIEHFGGQIRVESAYPERGTTFIFTWKIANTQSE